MPPKFFKRSPFARKTGMKAPKYYVKNNSLDSTILYPNLPRFLQIALIDPGTVSCGLRIVRYYLESKSMVVIWFSVINFGNNTFEINSNLEIKMEPVASYLSDCHHIVIESQLMKQKIVYQCFSVVICYITNRICTKGMLPSLIEVDAQLKTVFLGGPKTQSQNNSPEMLAWMSEQKRNPDGTTKDNDSKEKCPRIKEWTKMKSIQFCKERGDLVSLHILYNSLYKPNEDLSDVVCYEYAWIPYLISRNDIKIPYPKSSLQ